MLKKFALIGIVSMLTISLTGCFEGKKNDADSGEKPKIEDESNESKKDEETEEDKKIENNKDTEKKEESVDTKKEEPKREEPKKEESKKEPVKNENDKSKEDKVVRIFNITTLNINEKPTSGGEVKTVGVGVADNIRKILEVVSKKYFDGHELELSDIETIKGKKIAVVDLKGDTKYWTDKMQGSTGGRITSYTLIENVLQRKYKGYWVNSVRFTLNGKPIQDTGHVPDLAKINHR